MTGEPTGMDDLLLAVRRFIARRIDSAEQLEVLLLLYRDASRYWDAAGIADALLLPERGVERHLEALGGRNLLDIRLTQSLLYRFNPEPAELALEVKQVAEAYRERRGDVLALLAPRRKSLKDFSDAFRLSRDPADG